MYRLVVLKVRLQAPVNTSQLEIYIKNNLINDYFIGNVSTANSCEPSRYYTLCYEMN